MKVAVALLTYNRQSLFLKTLNSMKYSGVHYFPVIVDNGSIDGTADIVRGLGGIVNDTGNHTTGRGMNIAIEAAMKCKPDLIVFTADDFYYRKGWLKRLVNFWENAPQDVSIASCYLEPLWSWNEIIKVDTAGERYAIRTSIPGSNWTFKAETVDSFYPLQEKTGGEDLAVCDWMRRQRYRLAALDLVIHTGEQSSAWGNESWKTAQPINKEALGFETWTE